MRVRPIRAISGANPPPASRAANPDLSMSSQAAPDQKARYTTGSTMRHVLVLASTGSIGLIAIFLVDFLNLFYISLLDDPSLTAAVGYASALTFFYVSLSVGMMIAATALVSRALGAGDRPHAREVAGSALAWLVIVTGVAIVASLPFVPAMLTLIGATGETRDVAAVFMWIVLPSTPLLGLGMCATGLLRATGDAKRAMFTTLWFGGVIAVLDPLLILALGLGVPGAAIATATARIGMVAYGLATLIRKHDLIARPSLPAMRRDFPPLAKIGIPAILTNIATPVGNGYMTAAMAPYGDAAVAAWTIISRLVPVAFGGLFALSGAVGPVVGQNFGAHLYDRVRKALTDSLIVSTVYVVAVSAIILLRTARDRPRLRSHRRSRRARPSLLPLPRDHLHLRRRALCLERRLQQPQLPGALDAPQLGPRHPRHRALRHRRRLGRWRTRERSPASSSAASRSASSRCSSPTASSSRLGREPWRATKRTAPASVERRPLQFARPRASDQLAADVGM